jgi:hypothetical protein
MVLKHVAQRTQSLKQEFSIDPSFILKEKRTLITYVYAGYIQYTMQV